MASIFQRRYASGATVWYLSYIDKKGVRKKDNLGDITKHEAKVLLQRKKLELLNNATGVAPAITFGSFMHEYLSWYKAQYPDSYVRTESILRLQFQPLLITTPINLIDRAALLNWRNTRISASPEDPVSRDTVNKEIQTLKAMLQRAVDTWKYIDANPLAKEGPKNVRDPLFFPDRGDEPVKFLEREQLEDLYKRSSPRNAALWKFMANTGLRAQEMAKLLIGDVDVSARVLQVVSYVDDPTKSRKSRVVPLNTMALDAFDTLRQFAPQPDARTGHVVRRMHEKSFLRLYVMDASRPHHHPGKSTPNPTPVPHLEGYGLPLNESSLHCLRHTFGAHMAMAGVDLRTLQRLMGHARLETTLVYANVSHKHMAVSTELVSL